MIDRFSGVIVRIAPVRYCVPYAVVASAVSDEARLAIVKASAAPVLRDAIEELETHWGWTAERFFRYRSRGCYEIRFDGGERYAKTSKEVEAYWDWRLRLGSRSTRPTGHPGTQ